MASVRVNKLVAAVIASSMFVSSTASFAAPAAAPQISPWAALTGLTAGAPAAALCGASAAAAQGAVAAPAGGCVLPAMDTPPSVAEAAPPLAPAPVVGAPAGYAAVSPLFLALGALAAGALVYFLVKNKHHTISPA